MSLIDHALEALRIATTLPGGTADPAVLRQRCEAALSDFSALAARAGHAGDGVEAARFALVALIDERAMAPGSPVRQAWLDQPLQLILFECASAGEEFYLRMERWRRPRSEADADVLEVFQTCLALGFRGMMAGDAAEPGRRQLAEQAATEVLAMRHLPEQGLSPHWLPPTIAGQAADTTSEGWLRLWLVPAAALLVVGAVWLLGRFWMSSVSEAMLSELR
jgi:type VI secretion system protein ImpK